MNNLTQNGYEQDMLDQPAALDAHAAQALPPAIAALDMARFDRIILTGMGSSHYATIPFELMLARLGLPVWRIQTGRLLEMPQLIAPRTLLWMTSQSGRSGEVVALVEQLSARDAVTIVATTNDPSSPLAVGADLVLPLQSGSEATVSSKSYLNTLASFYRVGAAISGEDDGKTTDDIGRVAASLSARLTATTALADGLAARILAGPRPRLALVGAGEDAATAMTGALILKEASKVAAEGYIGGEFRHGPMEIVGAGATVLLFGSGKPEDVTLTQLARDLVGTGSLVLSLAPDAYPGTEHVPLPNANMLERLAHAMVFVQQLSLGLARGSGLVPGKFLYGQKITSQV
ncbi:SIS domain-containing protein [Acidisoma cellulosilytica]|uniref:Glutamine--fructose-6-phosphate aminotransferase [isomerizing] n=1 Tax=Acidisoma cellulosilyticum TaxID=2802395 RepID=A0A963Z2F6_9PROT|nr:SIS domain-containing protein [Acidisoma cellulosilyticum]MCB8881376.1 SIS domain-containing protein [Acidisoma cellulosilyticum]